MKSLSLISILLTLCFFQIGSANIPRTISYQGQISDAAGQPVADGEYTFFFALYPQPTGGAAAWSETQQLLVEDGLFHALLGSSASLDIAFQTPYWLGISLNDAPELLPRIALSASAYSLYSETIADSAVSNGKIRSYSITSNKIAAAQLVKSINGMTDDIDLQAGENVNINADGNKLIISASGNASGGDITAVAAGNGLTGGGSAGDVSLAIAVPLALSGDPAQGGVLDVNASDTSGAALIASADGGGYAIAGYRQGVTGGHFATENFGHLGSNLYGVYGEHYNSGNYGFIGSEYYSVFGSNSNTFGFLGSNQYGAYGFRIGHSYGYLGSADYSVFGSNIMVHTKGYLAGSNIAVYGEVPDNGEKVAIQGVRQDRTIGMLGTGNEGVLGIHQTTGAVGILGKASAGVYGFSENYAAALFDGRVTVLGTLEKSAGSFKIDHPLDPANKYLYHSFVESPDMMNIYNGNVTLDESGSAVVEMPEWFQALNMEFRYQLTCIGGFAPVYIAKEMNGNRFSIAGGTGGLKVSWQVTGIRNDPFARANRIPVEKDKSAQEKGRYLYPAAHNAPETAGLYYMEKQQVAESANAAKENMLKAADEDRKAQAEIIRSETGQSKAPIVK